MGPDRPWALLLGALGVALLAGCGVSREARASLGAGRQAVAQGAFREALEHLRTATRLAPDFAPAQLAQGEAAEVLGEFEEALGAYRLAVGLSPSTTTQLRLGEMADRMGRMELATQSLDGAYGSWRERAWYGLKVGLMSFVACVPKHWTSVSALLTQCLPEAFRTGRAYFRASRESVPEYIFRILVEAEIGR